MENNEMKIILERLDNMDGKISNLDKKVSSIQLTIENEIRNNIQLIAEGHMALERKLDESLKVNQEKEMLLIRVNRLETEVRELKERIEKIS